MKHITYWFAVFVTALTLSNTASAATVEVDFSFSTVSGTLTFNDGIGDTTADAISFSSNNFGENSLTWSAPFPNQFSWTGSEISSADFDVDSTTHDPLITLYIDSSSNIIELECFDLDLGNDCWGSEAAHRGSLFSFATFTTKLPTPVPLPAGLPLVLTGLAGFAGLRMRKKRKAQV